MAFLRCGPWSHSPKFAASPNKRIYQIIEKRVAYVVSSDLPYGMGRIYQKYNDATPEDFRVFRSLEEAERWLEVKISDMPTDPD